MCAAYGEEATDPATTPDGARLASWGRRLAAYLIDGLLIAVISLPLTWHWLTDYVGDTWHRIEESVDTRSVSPTPFAGTFDSWGELVVIVLVTVAIFVVYHAGFLRYGDGASPGKRLLGIRVRLRHHDGRMPWSAIGQRLLVQLAPGIAALIPLLGSLVGIFAWADGLWPLWDAKYQALHDKWPATNVVHRQ
jgi:uncharacterized RDD family membrane protein YckC